MVCEKAARKYCCEDISKIENYDKAIADTTKVWDCHHRLEKFWWWDCPKEELIKQGMYYNQPADRLIFLEPSEHMTIHHSGKKHRLGKHHSSETRKKMSESHKRTLHSLETRKKMSASAAKKPVSQYSQDGVLLATFPSAMDAQRQTGIGRTSIVMTCRFRQKSSGGFIWKYSEKVSDPT